MRKKYLYIILALFSQVSFATERLEYTVDLNNIQATFNAVPVRQTVQNEINTSTQMLVSYSINGGNAIFHGLGEINRTDGRTVVELGNDYSQKVARGISSSETVSASVVPDEYDSNDNIQVTFKIDLSFRGVNGIGYYWAFINNNITYQAYTWCLGRETISSCMQYHLEYIDTVKYR